MNNMNNEFDGMFETIDSFAIRKRNEFYLIGKLTEGSVQEDWYICIPFNSSLSMSVKINTIEEVEISSENEPYTLLILDCTEEVGYEKDMIDLLLALKIGSEFLPIVKDNRTVL